MQSIVVRLNVCNGVDTNTARTPPLAICLIVDPILWTT